MTSVATTTRTELAQRSSAGIDVTLFWERHDGVDTALVSVYDRETGAFFEIVAEPQLALDTYHHPFAYREQAGRQGTVAKPPEPQPGHSEVGGAES